MSAPGLPPKGRAAEEAELLAQLGLPTSAAPEDVDKLHQVASEFLATAPSSLRGWAHAQAAALDAAYLHLTDPAGFGGSALRSPSRPPAVEPGGPATPPARRGSRSAAAPAPEIAAAAAIDEDEVGDDVDLDDLYASVTPSAHSDMRGDAKSKARAARAIPGAVQVVPASAGTRRARTLPRFAVAGVGIVAVVALLFGVYKLGGGGIAGAAVVSPSPSPSGPTVDLAKVQSLMQALQASPNDIVTLESLGDTYYAGQDYVTAGSFYDKVLAIDPKNVKALLGRGDASYAGQDFKTAGTYYDKVLTIDPKDVDALLARGAVSFNLGDQAAAQKSWQQAITVDPKNQEAYYDLGFMYLNQSPTPDWTGVQREWNQVIALDPTTQLAQLVQQHLDALASASMIPASPVASGAASPAASDSPAASGPAASASPATSSQP